MPDQAAGERTLFRSHDRVRHLVRSIPIFYARGETKTSPGHPHRRLLPRPPDE